MMPIYDMMRQAQNGEAMRAMARQFGVSEKQIADAFAALAPAFSTGLKRNVDGPQPLADFLSALSDGRHRRYFEDLQAAFSPQGVAEGNGILGHIFGSKELSRQVAAEAARATGIAQETLKQMLPVMASMVMGGLFKQAMEETDRPEPRQEPNPVGDMLREMQRWQTQMTAGSRPQNPPDPSPYAAFGQMMESIIGRAGAGGSGGAGASAATGRSQSEPFADNPFARIARDMMMAGVGRPEAPQPEPDQTAADGKRDPYAELFGTLFEAGREVQAGYQKSVEAIFDQHSKRGSPPA